MRGSICLALAVLLVAVAGCDDAGLSGASRAGRETASEPEVAAPSVAERPSLWMYPMSTGEYAAEYNAASSAAPGAIPNPYSVAQTGSGIGAAALPGDSFAVSAAPGTVVTEGFVSEAYVSEPYVEYAPTGPMLVGPAPYPLTGQPRGRSPYDPLFNGGALPPPSAPVVIQPAPVIVQGSPVVIQPVPVAPLQILPADSDPLGVTVYTDTVAPAPVLGVPARETVVSRAVDGMQLVPAPDVPPGIHPNDAAPSQWFEILRPNNGPIRIGRVSATCVCVGVRVPKRQIEAGERALIEARTVTRPPRNNLTYGIYVNIVEPERAVLDADVTIRY